MIDHPVIARLEQTGTPDGKAEIIPICPICGQEAEDIYKNTDSLEIVGCDNCIQRMNVWSALEMEDI